MTRSSDSNPAFTADVVALAALAWVSAATLHEGAGHGIACEAMGGAPLTWSSFHFECARQAMSLTGVRVVAGAGTVINLILMALGWAFWRSSTRPLARLFGWIIFALNGFTSFGYLVFSATFDIGDWNRSGVMTAVANMTMARTVLAVIGIGGYYAVVRAAAAMLSRELDGRAIALEARRLAITVWLTTGAISLLAALAAGHDWRSTMGASIGVALGGNAGLFSVSRFTAPGTTRQRADMRPNWPLRVAAGVAVVSFVAVLGPGVAV